MRKRKLPLTVMAMLLPFLIKAQQSPVVKWTVKAPFEQKVFIENKGQYDLQGTLSSTEILFGARQGGLQYYFTNHSVWIKKDVLVKRTDEEIEAIKRQLGEKSESESKEEREVEYKMVPQFHQLEFLNANPTATITSSNETSWYYTFGVAKNSTVTARAFKKLTYNNLYPGIDMEFYFPEDKQGYEYSFIVHPGADLSQIEIQYPQFKNLQLEGNGQGNIVTTSSYGKFIDNVPVASQPGKTITCSFSYVVCSGKKPFFRINAEDYDKTKDLLIDPITITPTFTGANDAYDVDWDNAGNCYAYGGSNPWQLVKYNSSGTLLWSYTESFNSPDPIYGGFAVDKISQSVYIVEGYNSATGSGVVKLNSAGGVVATFPGNSSMNEMYRVKFSQCSHEAVIAAGGTCCPNQSCYLDTTLVTLTPVNSLGASDGFHDMWGVALDDSGYCYMAVAQPVYGVASEFNNVMVKLPMPSLAPNVWSANDGYRFQEVNSVAYNKASYAPNGYNGMTVSGGNLYTYDSYKLKKWSTHTGVLSDSAVVNTPKDDSLMYWGGLTSNSCDNIFAGSQSSVIQFGSNLNQVNSFAMPDTVYDVSLGNNNTLYVSGVGFISAQQVTLPSCNSLITSVSSNITPATCASGGSVTVTPSGGTPPYSITWNTTPAQSGLTAADLAPGVYIATISDFSCSGQSTVYDTVNVPTSGGRDSVAVNNASVCSGTSATLTATGALNYAWSPATGLSATTGNSVIANPTADITYMIIGSGSGCADTVYSVVTVGTSPSTPTITVSGDTLKSSSSANNQWYKNGSLIPGATSQTYIISGTGNTYYVVVTNPENDCSATSTSTSGINQLSTIKNQLSIYPNPFNNNVFIKISSSITNLNGWHLQITDVLGQLLYKAESLNYLNEVDMSQLPSAMYFISITNGSDRTVFKVIKQE